MPTYIESFVATIWTTHRNSIASTHLKTIDATFIATNWTTIIST